MNDLKRNAAQLVPRIVKSVPENARSVLLINGRDDDLADSLRAGGRRVVIGISNDNDTVGTEPHACDVLIPADVESLRPGFSGPSTS